MKVTKLYSGQDGNSQFVEMDYETSISHELGMYSEKYPVKGMMFRSFESNLSFDWHNAPQPQYILYLEGEVEVEASNGEKRIFQPGSILFATDLTGKGHITRTLTKGRCVVITTEF